jgi:phage terminase large subunit
LENNRVIDKWKLFEKIGYNPTHPEVRRFHDSKAQTKVVTAPRRGSKSYSGSHDALPEVFTPGCRIWIVGPNYGLAEKEFRVIHDIVVRRRKELGLPAPKINNYNVRSGSLYLHTGWGSIVECKTADNPESLLGEAVDVVIYSEAAQLKRYIRERYVQPTLITKRGREIIPTTPDQGGDWVYELVQKGNSGEFDDVGAFSWDVKANPTYPMEEYERAKKHYGENHPVFREQYKGEWVFHSGRVYPEFQAQTHIIEPFDIPKDWRVVRAVDFGYRDPFVCLWAAVGPENELYFFQEYYEREGKTLREHAQKIIAMSEGYRISRGVGDPSSKQSIEDLSIEGVTLEPGNNDRMAGRLRVGEYLVSNTDNTPPWSYRDTPQAESRTKWPKMYVFNTCPELIREFKYFRWAESKAIEGNKEKTEGDDHAMDTMRYLTMTRPSPFRKDKYVPQRSFAGILGNTRMNRYKAAGIGANG